MKILITGAAGFVGANLAHRLSGHGHQMMLVDDLSFGYKENLPNCIPFIKWDFAKLDSTLKEYDVLVHLATSNIIFAQENPVRTMVNNGVNTSELFKRFQGKIIYTSTASVYGNASHFPTTECATTKRLNNAYDSSKRMAEIFLQQRGNYTTLRLSNVYGRFQRPENPYCGVIGRFIEQAWKREPITIYGEGSATRDYTYADDVVDAIVMAIEQDAKNTEINIATAKETSVIELAALIHKVVGTEERYTPMPERSIDQLRRRCLSNTLAKQLLGWEPKFTLEEGLRETLNFYLHLPKATSK